MRTRWMRGLALAMIAALLCALTAVGAAEETAQSVAQDITSLCAFKVSEGSKKKLTDGSEKSTWSYDHIGAYAGLKLPEGITPGRLLVEWMFDPTGVVIDEYDDAQQLIRTRDQSCTFPGIVADYQLLPETRYVALRMTVAGQEIGEIHVYSAGTPAKDVQIWDAPCEKAALMVVSAHQDDELIFFGGTIPYYAIQRQYPTQVVYMANCTRHRRTEALNGLWVMGVRNFPDFINLQDGHSKTLEEGAQKWGGANYVLGLLVERIRKYRPEVIVTHDLNGEYGHDQHKLTAYAVRKAVELASDPAQYPESAARYGAWQVKKLYLHLYPYNQIMMDWNAPLDAFGGHTALEAAQYGYAQHVSQQKYYQVLNHGTYDNALFGLAFTTVGEDVAKNDFFEHIDLTTIGDASAAAPITSAAGTETAPAQPEAGDEAQALTDANADAGAGDLLPADGAPQAEAGDPAQADESGAADDESASRAVATEIVAGEQTEDQSGGAAPESAAGETLPAGGSAEPANVVAADAPPARSRERGGGWVLGAAGLLAIGGGATLGLRAMNARKRRTKRRRR